MSPTPVELFLLDVDFGTSRFREVEQTPGGALVQPGLHDFGHHPGLENRPALGVGGQLFRGADAKHRTG